MGLLRLLQKAGILKVLFEGSGSRPATLAFPELINIAEGRQVLTLNRRSVHRHSNQRVIDDSVRVC